LKLCDNRQAFKAVFALVDVVH